MTLEQQQVKHFMQAFGQETPDKPCIPSLEVRKLRAKLMLEEVLETIAALGLGVGVDDGKEIIPKELHIYNNFSGTFLTLEEIADGLGDKHYVGYCGTAVACGIDMEPIFQEIHRSNMTKFWSEQEVKDQITKNPDCKVEKYGDGLYRFIRPDGKVIKSPSYSPANLKPIIEQQQQ